MRQRDIAELVASMLAGSKASLAHLITLVEEGSPDTTEIESLIRSHLHKAYRIGITGPTGAGISTESGIPDFHSPGGIWDRFDPDDFTYQKFVSSLETRKKQWQLLSLGALIANMEPNPAHYAIAELYRLGKLDCVITQNIDNLHQRAGVPDDRVFELHGSMRWARCLNCDHRFPMEEILPGIKEGIEVPDCPNCGGLLKPGAVFFGEQLPQGTLLEATHHSQNCDLFIVIGSSLVVYPAAYMPVYARDAGARIAIVNLTDTDLDRHAAVVIHSKAGETLSGVIEKVRQKLPPGK